MNDQTQQSQGQQQSGQTPNSSLASQRYNPWEGTPDPNEATGGNDDQQQQQQSAATQQAAGQQGATQSQPGAQPQQQQAAGQQQQAGAGTGSGQQVAQQAGLSADAISEIVAKTVASAIPAATQQQQPQQQFTEQDFIRTFNVFQPTPEILASIGLPNTPETVQAFSNITTAVVRQAVTMAAYQMERLKRDLHDHIKESLAPYEPAKKFAQERAVQQLQEEFLAQHQDLKGFEPLLHEIYSRLESQGVRFKTKDEAFKTVAEHARAIIKQLHGLSQQQAQGDGQQTQTGQSTNTNNGASRMSGLSGSGQGGAGGSRSGAGGTRKKNTAEQLFG